MFVKLCKVDIAGDLPLALGKRDFHWLFMYFHHPFHLVIISMVGGCHRSTSITLESGQVPHGIKWAAGMLVSGKTWNSGKDSSKKRNIMFKWFNWFQFGALEPHDIPCDHIFFKVVYNVMSSLLSTCPESTRDKNGWAITHVPIETNQKQNKNICAFKWNVNSKMIERSPYAGSKAPLETTWLKVPLAKLPNRSKHLFLRSSEGHSFFSRGASQQSGTNGPVNLQWVELAEGVSGVSHLPWRINVSWDRGSAACSGKIEMEKWSMFHIPGSDLVSQWTDHHG